MWLLVLFIAVPLIEIILLIQVGGWLGLWPTIAIIIMTAMIGTVLVRKEGANALAQLRLHLNNLDDPTEPLAHGAMILFSGALLLTPGFFTDALGFALLVPAIRRRLLAYAQHSVASAKGRHWERASERPSTRSTTIIEGTFTSEEATRSPGKSGWTEH